MFKMAWLKKEHFCVPCFFFVYQTLPGVREREREKEKKNNKKKGNLQRDKQMKVRETETYKVFDLFFEKKKKGKL